jgi:hypothetical protein
MSQKAVKTDENFSKSALNNLPSPKNGHQFNNKLTNLTKDKINAAFFYGITSFAVIFTNKYVMTEYKFHYFNFLAFFQFVVTTLILGLLALFKKIEIPFLTSSIFREIFPISVMFLGMIQS